MGTFPDADTLASVPTRSTKKMNKIPRRGTHEFRFGVRQTDKSGVLTFDQKLVDAARLRQVFSRLRARVNASGGEMLPFSSPVRPTLSLGWVLQNEELVVKSILQTLRRRDFSFDSFKRTELRQSSGKVRAIYISNWIDRIVLMVMAQILTEAFELSLSDRVFSFRKGRGPQTMLRQLVRYVASSGTQGLYVLRRDISSYGDSISHLQLQKIVQAKTDTPDESYFLQLLAMSLRNPFMTSKDGAEACLCVGIPSGSPLVPPLENIFLNELDRDCESVPGGFYARYGDDFIFAHPDRSIALCQSEKIDHIVANLELTIKDEKRQNLFLKSVKSESAEFIDDHFRPRRSFQILGRRVTNRAQTGPKLEKFAQCRGLLEKHLRMLLTPEKVNLFTDEVERLHFLKCGVKNMFLNSAPQILDILVFDNGNPEIVRTFDRLKAEVFATEFARAYGLNRPAAWRLYKSLRVPSLTYNRTQVWYHGKKRRDIFHEPLRKIQ